jgi:hypothetical protein
MLLWTISIACLLISIRLVWSDLMSIHLSFGLASQRRELLHVASTLRNLEEILLAGIVPSFQQWEDLKKLIPPWGKLSYDCLKELRAQGSALLPTLKRLRGLAESHALSLENARTRSAQAFAQIFACGFLVPFLGTALYYLLPDLEKSRWFWFFCCGVALISTGIGSVWLVRMTAAARWGGLRTERRSWVLDSECAGERFLAMIRCGTPPDLAWLKACEFLSSSSKELTLVWGHSVWEIPSELPHGKCEQIIGGAGHSIKKAIQISLMEGRGCADRVETAMSSLRSGIEAQVERELSLLATRALRPLFIFVAPAILGLLGAGIWISSAGVLMQALAE